jgi:DNA helicase IV
MLQRDPARAWTESDLPLLDAARRRIGDPEATRVRRRQEAVRAADREEMDRVIDHLIASNELDDGEGVMTMLHGEDVRNSLVDEAAVPRIDSDLLAGPFAHIIVDEAQELTDAEWGMLLSRCPSRSFTIVGDRAQARHGFTESWEERLDRVGFRHVRTSTLSVNYRTPEEVMVEAEPVIRAVLPDANVPTAVRRSGLPVRHGSTADLEQIVTSWLDAHAEGIACIIGDPSFAPTTRVRSLPPQHAKGLEFDLVVLVDPEAFGDGIEGAVDRYVAMTRATQQLVILTSAQHPPR